MPRNPDWTPEENRLLRALYGLVPPAEIARRLASVSPVPRNRNAVIVHANKLGLDSRKLGRQDLVSVKEAAERLQTSKHVIYHHADEGRITLVGRGKNKFLDAASYDWLRQHYPRPPARWVPASEMRRRLGYSETHSSRLLLGGAIRAVKRGGRWYVDADHLDLIERRMRESGMIRLDHSGNAGMEPYRAECRRNQARRKRRERRKVA